MLLSICIPQYNRTTHLTYSLERLRNQTYTDFEVCISDDCSTDERTHELTEYLLQSGLNYKHHRQPTNIRYDANLRHSFSMATGTYCLAMGNDDCLADSNSLAILAEHLAQHPNTAIGYTNYKEHNSATTYLRCSRTAFSKGTPHLSATIFRNFSFISGIFISRQLVEQYATSDWDGSEMYQVYLATRILASGGGLLTISSPLIHKSISIPGEEVESYATRATLEAPSIAERRIPLTQLGSVAYNGLCAGLEQQSPRYALLILAQLFIYTYPFWLLEYRRVHSYAHAFGICRGMRPRNTYKDLHLPIHYRCILLALYISFSTAGLLTPLSLFDICRPWLYKFAKRQ